MFHISSKRNIARGEISAGLPRGALPRGRLAGAEDTAEPPGGAAAGCLGAALQGLGLGEHWGTPKQAASRGFFQGKIMGKKLENQRKS